MNEMSDDRFKYLANLLPWNVEPEDKEDYDEVQKVVHSAVMYKLGEMLERHRGV